METPAPSGNLPATMQQPARIAGLYGSQIGAGGADTVGPAIRQLARNPDARWTYCSIPPGELQGVPGAARLGRIKRGPARELKTLANTVIEVKHVLIHPGKHVEENGELLGFVPRILLVAGDDTVVSCGADSVLDWIDELISCGCPPPWDPPLRVKVEIQPIEDARQVYVLTIQDQPSKGRK